MKISKTSFYLVVLSLPLFLIIYSCKEDSILLSKSDNQKSSQFLNYSNWTYQEKKFFELNRSDPNNLSYRGIKSMIYHPLLIDSYNKLVTENQISPFVDSISIRIGFPDWERSYVYQDTSYIQGLVVIPTLFPNRDSISGLIILSSESQNGINSYIINGISRQELFKTDTGNYNQKSEWTSFIISYEENFFGQTTPTLSKTTCSYLDLVANYPFSDFPNRNDCVWRAIEICQYRSYEWISGLGSLPPHLDHDRDGIPNEDDQDWGDFSARHGDISQEEYENYIYDYWEDYYEDEYGDYDDFWNGEYFDDFDLEDWYDFDWFADTDWGEFFDDIWIFDRDEDYYDNHCPDYDFLAEIVNRSIECKWYYVLDCGAPGDFSQDILRAFDEVIPCSTCEEDEEFLLYERASNYCDLNRLPINFIQFLATGSCPVNVPEFVTEECFGQQMIDYYLSLYPHLTFSENQKEWFISKPTNFHYLDRVIHEFPLIDLQYVIDISSQENGTEWLDFRESYKLYEAFELQNGPFPEIEEIFNGVIINSIYVPTGQEPTGTKIGQFLPRETEDQDLDNSLISDNNIYLSDNLDNGEYFTNMENTFHFLSPPNTDMREVVDDFLYKFMNDQNQSDEFNIQLCEKIITHKGMLNSIKKFGEDLESKLVAVNGVISEIAPYNFSNSFRPIFGSLTDYSTGFTILINDIEKGEVILIPNSYSYVSSTKEWQGTFYFDIIDHFGLDTEDAIQYQWIPGFGAGFSSWWRLQHRRGRFPFLNETRVVVTLSGRLN